MNPLPCSRAASSLLFLAALLWHDPARAQEALATQQLGYTYSSAIRATRNTEFLVIRNLSDWAAAWTLPYTDQHGSLNWRPQDLPAVDFGRSVVAGIILPTESSTCTAVRMTSATAFRSEIVVTYWVRRPQPPHVICGASFRTAFQFMRLDRADLPVRFVEVEEPEAVPARQPR